MNRVPSLRSAVGCVLCLAALAAVGCGGVKTKPYGKVVINGAPYKPGAGETLQITFIGEGPSGISAVAQVNPDGTFMVPGPTNTGIPAGKYHITMTTMAGGGPGGSGGGGAAAGGDRIQAKYGNATQTPLGVDIPASNPPLIVIDVGSGTVTTGS